jgi:hypothetical protein
MLLCVLTPVVVVVSVDDVVFFLLLFPFSPELLDGRLDGRDWIPAVPPTRLGLFCREKSQNAKNRGKEIPG